MTNTRVILGISCVRATASHNTAASKVLGHPPSRPTILVVSAIILRIWLNQRKVCCANTAHRKSVLYQYTVLNVLFTATEFDVGGIV